MRRLLGRYVVGLRLSFNVATAYLPWELIDQPDPVVRVSENHVASGFDPREVIPIDGRVAIITLPHATMQADSVSLISLN